MTTATETSMESVGLDDAPSFLENGGSFGTPTSSEHSDKLETELSSSETVESDDNDDFVVTVEDESEPLKTLPRLQVPDEDEMHWQDETDAEVGGEKDYVDTRLFSPEMSRHSLEVAYRRAKALAVEIKEEQYDEEENGSNTNVLQKLLPSTKVKSSLSSSVSKLKHIVAKGEREYDLVAGTSPGARVEDIDGDGLQLSPEEGSSFVSTPKIRPALKRISKYSHLDSESEKEKEKKGKSLKWEEDEVEGSESDAFLDDVSEESSESSVLNYRNGSPTSTSQVPRRKSMRNKKKGIRRLSPKEKEELYKVRPDLQITPNWAQKYREEMGDMVRPTRWSLWLLLLIAVLTALLVTLIVLIARAHAVAEVQPAI